jgi:nucleoside recognition membrane protein YjiH
MCDREQDEKETDVTEQEEPGLKGYIALLVFALMFSGVLRGTGPWSALDFTTLIGEYGEIYDGLNFLGKGAEGARAGFMQGFQLVAIIMFAMGLVELAEHYNAMKAAQKLLTPLMRPLTGLPGVAAITFLTSINSSDAGGVMTRRLYQEGKLTEDERTIFVSMQFAGSSALVGVFASGAPLLPLIIWSPGLIFVVIILMKLIGANLVRLYLAAQRGTEVSEEKRVA